MEKDTLRNIDGHFHIFVINKDKQIMFDIKHDSQIN